MNDTGRVKEKLKKGEPAFGGWLSTNSAASAEIMAYAGFDWVAVDVEHSSSSISDVESIARAVKLHGCKPLVRVFDNSAISIRRALDAGAEGIIVPMIRSVTDVQMAVEAAKYPPTGKRGAGVGAGNLYGANLGEYVKNANDNVLVIVMVETKEAVGNIEKILLVEGVDGIFLGPYDLSASYGITGLITDPIITGAIERVFEACQRYGKAAGIHILSEQNEAVRNAVEKGFLFLALSYDASFIYQGSRKILEKAREAANRRFDK